MIFTDIDQWLVSVDEKAIDLIDLGPAETWDERGDIIYDIVVRATSETLHYSYTKDNVKEVAEKSLFKSVLISGGKLIPKEIDKISESYKLLTSIKKYISENLANKIAIELKRQWLKDKGVQKYLKKLEKDIYSIFLGVGEYETKNPHRPADLLLNGILYKCHIAFEKKSFYSKNNKIAEFINTLYNKEVFPSKSGAELIRKRINYLFKTKSEKSMEEQWNEMFKYRSSRFGLRFDMTGKGTLINSNPSDTA